MTHLPRISPASYPPLDSRAPAGFALSRRAALTGGAAFLAGINGALAAPSLDLEGLYREDWLPPTSGNLKADFINTQKTGKNFALLWEMRGCGWCKRLHLETFAAPGVADYLRENFTLIQLNLRGKREIAGFDGEKLTQEALSYKLDINSTPTFQFFKPSDAAAGKELGRAGFVEAADFLPLLHFLREKAYEKGTYEEWIKEYKSRG
jgi:thioredoxin-related protein